MRILVINAGSSSVKFSVFADDKSVFKSSLDKLDDVVAAVSQIPDILIKNDIDNPQAVAHRVAHGGEVFKDACLIDDAVISGIEANSPLAPLHNPPNLAGIRMAQTYWPDVPQHFIRLCRVMPLPTPYRKHGGIWGCSGMAFMARPTNMSCIASRRN